MTTIVCKNISKQFRNQFVLRNISMEFTSGHIYGITGRNGSGKTVLLKTICGLIPPTDGEVLINGENILDSQRQSTSIGALIERPGFLPQYSGLHNLWLLASLRNVVTKKDIEVVMREVGLEPQERKPVRTYSLGMKQKLGIAQAIMENPDIIILDEPLNAIDKESVIRIRSLIKRMQAEGKLVMVCSHIQDDIDCLADKIFHMEDGSLISKVKHYVE